MESQGATMQDYIALFRRRQSVMFATFSAVSIAVVFGTLLLDDQYRSTATIAIERPEIPENMVRTTFTYFDTDLRVDRIRDRVLSSPRVEGWIKSYDLYADIVAEYPMSAAVSEFRDDVEVVTIQAREDIAIKKQGETIAFDVSYYGETPAKAVLVATDLANMFLEENRASRNQAVEETVAFFQRDADRLARKIEDVEAKLADFKEKHAGALPESSSVNTQMLDRRERELEDVEREIRVLRETRQILETDLSRESPNAPIFTTTGETILAGPDRLRLLQQQFVELSAKYGPEHPDVIRTQREIDLLSGGAAAGDADSIRQELSIARREYAAAQRYTANHPDVVSLANKVRTLEAQLVSASSVSQEPSEARPDNPAYIAIFVQMEAADVEISALQQRARSLRSRIGQLESRLLESPQVEREYLVLQREYDRAIRDYDEVRAKQNDAQQAQDLEASEKGERYVLQHTPGEPTSAAFPNRIAVIILGMILAIVCALGAMVVFEVLDTRVRGIRDLRSLTGGTPPIAIIPVLETQAGHRRQTYIWSSSIIGVSGLLVYMIAIQI